MKMLIKSITSVITNSSSEVFIMDSEHADKILHSYDTDGIIVEDITEDYLEFDGRLDAEAIIEVAGLKDKLTDDEKKIFYNEEKHASEEEWREFYQKHKKQINHNLLGKSFINIEDYFRDSRLALDDAKECCVWHEYNH